MLCPAGDLDRAIGLISEGAAKSSTTEQCIHVPELHVPADGRERECDRDRATVESWFRTGKRISPLTRINKYLVQFEDTDLVPEIPSADVDDGPTTLTELVELLSAAPVEIDLRGRVLRGSETVRTIYVRESVTVRNGTLAVDVNVVCGGHLTLESVDVLRDPNALLACSYLRIEGAVTARTCKFDGCVAHVIRGGTLAMTDCVIARAPGQTGINVFGGDSEAICTRCCFNANEGRAVFLSDGGGITLEDCVTDRTATALYVGEYPNDPGNSVIRRGSVRVDTCEFSDRCDRRGPLGPAYANIVVRSLTSSSVAARRCGERSSSVADSRSVTAP